MVSVAAGQLSGKSSSEGDMECPRAVNKQKESEGSFGGGEERVMAQVRSAMTKLQSSKSNGCWYGDMMKMSNIH